MQTERSLPTSRLDCPLDCRTGCEYRPEVVEYHLGVMGAMAAKGEDPCARLASARYGVDTSTIVAGPTTIWDIQQAVAELRAERREVTPVNVSLKLCPFALDS